MTRNDRAHVEVASIADLRDWLAANHATHDPVWLVTFKKGHRDFLSWGEAVEELICWGWVDSMVRALDDRRTMHMIGPRRENATWSAVNKKIVADMRAAGRMQPAGEALVEAAKANGMWTFLDDVDRLEVPADLDLALGGARDAWDGWTRSVRRDWLLKIKSTKTEATRAKHIAACVEAARRG